MAASAKRSSKQFPWPQSSRACCSIRSTWARRWPASSTTRARRFADAARVLFVHTGGQPALFGYQGLLAAHLEVG